jgi:hypothetical protein
MVGSLPGQSTERAPRKPFRLDSKRMVEPCPIIFPGDARGQLDKLALIEPQAEAIEQLV